MIETTALQWVRDLNGALSQAKSTSKFVLLDVFNPG